LARTTPGYELISPYLFYPTDQSNQSYAKSEKRQFAEKGSPEAKKKLKRSANFKVRPRKLTSSYAVRGVG